MMLLLELLQQYVLIENTHDLFDYKTFALRFETRFGKRRVRDDYTPEELQNVAQNTLDINAPFLQLFSAQTLDPFKTWGDNETFSAGTTRTDTTTPNLTDTTTPNLTDTTTPNLTDETKHTGTVSAESGSDIANENFVNAYDNAETSNPLNNSKTHETGNQTNTFDNADTTTHNGTSTVTHSGNTTVEHTGNTTTKSENGGTDSRARWGWKVDDYEKVMAIYINFIDMVIDIIAKDILYIVVRG